MKVYRSTGDSPAVVAASRRHIAAALTPASPVPKMTPEVQRSFANHSEVAMSPPTEPTAPLNLFRAIATDLHFWIPLSVLAGGLLLLDKLR